MAFVTTPVTKDICQFSVDPETLNCCSRGTSQFLGVVRNPPLRDIEESQGRGVCIGTFVLEIIQVSDILSFFLPRDSGPQSGRGQWVDYEGGGQLVAQDEVSRPRICGNKGR